MDSLVVTEEIVCSLIYGIQNNDSHVDHKNFLL